MEIYITTKNVYGNDLFYVKDKFTARVIRQLTGRKTVSRLDIDNLSLLGVKVRVSEEAQEALGWTAEEAGTKAVNQADMEAWRLGKEQVDKELALRGYESVVRRSSVDEVDMKDFKAGDRFQVRFKS